MTAVPDPYAIKARLPRTWPLFFARHGTFTPVQLRTVPHLLDGADALIMAPTASGKTAAVVAPLFERYWGALAGADDPLTILYVCPTRALVRDLHRRLRDQLGDAGVRLMLKTGDVGRVSAAGCLITTPESIDSLLTQDPRRFISVRAIVIDEIHLFDNTPRGDQLRCLLRRIEHIRQVGAPDGESLQRVLLSATVVDPAGLVARYAPGATVVDVPGQRPIAAEVALLADEDALVERLAARAARKMLLFCNARAEVEETAALLRRRMPHEARIFVHYGNLDARVRHEVETAFAAASVAVCCTTSTLELGVDIGTVDDIVLLGAPPTVTSLLQRIGRGNRRSAETRVLCLARSSAEAARFEGLLALARDTIDYGAARYVFRPSVIVQQIFSRLKQSPTGAFKLADVRRLAPADVTDDALRAIVSHLTHTDYLRPGRLGEWRPAARLQEMIDRHEIYGNIGFDALVCIAIDGYSGRVIAATDRRPEIGRVVLFGGRPWRVAWHDGQRFGLVAADGEAPEELLRYHVSHAAVPFAVAQAVARTIGLPAGAFYTLPTGGGMWMFHFAGTVWGRLLAALLSAYAAEAVNEYCLYVAHPIATLPAWDEKTAATTARRLALGLGDRLEMGRFHGLLPRSVAVGATAAAIDVDGFGRVYRAARLAAGDRFAAELRRLLA